MSRAFLKEEDGWAFCREKNRDCMFAGGDGACSLRRCKYEPQDPPPAQKKEAK